MNKLESRVLCALRDKFITSSIILYVNNIKETLTYMELSLKSRLGPALNDLIGKSHDCPPLDFVYFFTHKPLSCFLLPFSFPISLVRILEAISIKLSHLSAEITFKNTFCEYHHFLSQRDDRRVSCCCVVFCQ